MPSQTDMTVQKLEEKLKNNPDSLVFSRLADSFRKSGDVQQAITICSKGVQSHPDYVTGRIILGRCYLEQENFNDAIKEFTKVCQLDRRNQIAIKMLADVFSKQGMEEKAGDLFNLLLKMDDENPSLQHLVTVFKGSNRTNLFEILGIEDLGIETALPPKTEEESADSQGVDEALEEAGILEAEDQADLPSDTSTDTVPDSDVLVEEPGIPEMEDAEDPLSDSTADTLHEAADVLEEAIVPESDGAESPPSDTMADTLPEAADMLEETEIPEMEGAEVPLSDATADTLPEAADILEEAGIPEMEGAEVPLSDATADTMPEAADMLEEAGISEMESTEVPLSDATADTFPEADDILDEAGLSEITEDQAEISAGAIEEEALDEPETILEEAAEAEPIEQADDLSSQELEDALFMETTEKLSATQKIPTDDIAVSEIEELAETIPEIDDQETGLDIEQPESDITSESLVAEEQPPERILSQGDDNIEEVSGLEDIPVPSENTVSAAQDPITEIEILPEVEPAEKGVTDPLVETGEEGTIVAEEILIPVDENQESVEIQVPNKDDISLRMDAMFGDESTGAEIGIGITTTDSVEELILGGDEDTIAVAADSQESSRLSDAFEDGEENNFSSRVENLFGDEEKIEEIITEEKIEPEPESIDELIPPVEVGSAPTEILDGEGLDVISDPDVERSLAVEEVDSGVVQTEPEVMDISSELQSPFEEPVTDKEIATTATEIIDVNTQKEPESDEVSESLVTDATAVFDRDMIRKLSASESEKISEGIDKPVSEASAPQTSLSSDEVISRLDEMFPTDDVPEQVHEEQTGMKDPNLEIPVDEEIGALQEGSFAETAEISVKPDEFLGRTREIPVISEETAASADAQLDDVSVPLETKEYLPDQIGGWENRKTESFEMDTLDADEPLTGEEVASRIDEMFTGEDDLGDMSLASIPDDDTDSQEEPVSEFYSESGDMASQEEITADEEREQDVQKVRVVTEEFTLDGDMEGFDEEAIQDETTYAFPVEEDAAFDETMGELAEESSLSEDDAAVDDLSLASISDEDTLESEPIGESDTESDDAGLLDITAAQLEEEVSAEGITAVETASEEELPLSEEDLDLSEDDVFADDESLVSIPAEESVEEEPVSEYYTESGDAISSESVAAVLDGETDESDSDQGLTEQMGVEELTGIDIEYTDSVTSLDSIPDEDSDEEDQTSEFYTETGEAAFETDEDGVDNKDTQTGTEDVVNEISSDNELTVIDEESALDDVSMETIPDDDDENEPVSEFYTETGELAAPDETEEGDIKEESDKTDDLREGLPESDSMISDDLMLADDQISDDSTEEEVLDEIDFDSADSDEFYTISGDDTPIPPAEDSAPLSSRKEILSEDGKETSVPLDEETIFVRTDSLPAGDGSEKSIIQKEDVAEKAKSIPDHVLTPTLADIYFQQDQPYLAVQIYKRLLERDPDNDRIVDRITEIEQGIKEREVQMERSGANGTVAKTSMAPKKRSSSQKKKSKGNSRPLKGIRIKKKVKERIKKKKKD